MKKRLVEMVERKESEMQARMGEIEGAVSAKEQEIARVQELFMSKLRELETSFVELSQDMAESEGVQVEASKRYVQQRVN